MLTREPNLAYQTFNVAAIVSAFKFRITRVLRSLIWETFNICHYFYAYHFSCLLRTIKMSVLKEINIMY
jgi:hypothetical protein